VRLQHTGIERAADLRAQRYLREEEEAKREMVSVAAQAVAALPDWLTSLAKWDFYATMTYDPTRPTIAHRGADRNAQPPSQDACRRHVDAYVKQVQNILGCEVAAVVAVENTKAGWPHFHALIACGGQTATQLRALWQPWYERRGFIKLSRLQVGDTARVAAYCAKYLAKDGGDLFLLGALGELGFMAQYALPTSSGSARKRTILA